MESKSFQKDISDSVTNSTAEEILSIHLRRQNHFINVFLLRIEIPSSVLPG